MRHGTVLSAPGHFQRTETTRRSCDPAARVRVENDAGLIEISAWETYEIEVVAHKHAPDEASLDLLAVEVNVTPEGILASYTSPQTIPNAWVDFVVRCPRMAALDIHSASGEILVSGFHAQSRAATASGTIRAARMRGTATLTSASGAIDGAALEGTVYARTASGRVNLHGQLAGNHRVETASGDITVEGVQGSIDARSASGSIAVEGQLSGSCVLRTVSGNISVVLLPGSELRASAVRAETTSGEVEVREAD